MARPFLSVTLLSRRADMLLSTSDHTKERVTNKKSNRNYEETDMNISPTKTLAETMLILTLILALLLSMTMMAGGDQLSYEAFEQPTITTFVAQP